MNTRISQIEELKILRETFYIALICKNEEKVLSMLHPEFAFTHADARLQKLNGFADQFLKDAALTIKRIDWSDQNYTNIGKVVLVHAICGLEMDFSGKHIIQRERFTEVYIRQTEGWKLVAIHAKFIQADH